MKISIDFETYSEAGYEWNGKKWLNKGGLKDVGISVYSEHPSTEVLCLAYKIDGKEHIWVQGDSLPLDLFLHIISGEVVWARNSIFEYFIWENVCHKRMGWPRLPISQLRDDQAVSLAWGMPASLDKCGKAMGMPIKVEDGKRLIKKFSIPRNPTKNDPRKRIHPSEDILDAINLHHYCLKDVEAEDAINEATPPLSPFETEVFLLDQKINTDGCQIDTESLKNCIAVIDQAIEKYTDECCQITGGVRPTEISKLKDWIESKGVSVENTQKETLEELLKTPLPPDIYRVVQLRLIVGASSIKKLYSLNKRISSDGRIRGMFQYCGASNTGRFAGRGPQPQNLPNSGGMNSKRCVSCGTHSGTHHTSCPWCYSTELVKEEWSLGAMESVLEVVKSRNLDTLEYYFGDAVSAISGAIRGLFIARPGYDLICSDYSAIEARVLAFLAEENWRMDVFRTHGKVYEMSASKISGIPFEEIVGYSKTHNSEKHPMRKLGKVAELASGYQGWIGAWKKFKADRFLNDYEIKEAILKWRDASPNIVKFWKTCENDARKAIMFPGHRQGMYIVENNVLYCVLPSGRRLNYHSPRLGVAGQIMFKGSDSKTGQWTWQDTYGGKLTENIVQAVSRDILVNAMVKLDRAGYDIVIHVHDEIVVEVPEGCGSVEKVEKIMGTMPAWCADWPIKAAGGWRGKRYRK